MAELGNHPAPDREDWSGELPILTKRPGGREREVLFMQERGSNCWSRIITMSSTTRPKELNIESDQ